MRTVLIVSPHFPPIHAPDLERVRLSLPFFQEFGWRPIVLAVDPTDVEGTIDPLLLKSIPPDVVTHPVRALPVRWTRMIGVGSIALRAFPFLYRAGAQLIERHSIDLVYFSTTMFPAMALGRLWKKKFGVPFVLDLQDPWVSDYYDNKPRSERPPKYWFAQRMHKILERWTMEAVDGLIAVSADYLGDLRSRYPWLHPKAELILPFAASLEDFTFVSEHPQVNRFFEPANGTIRGVYTGRGGKIMAPTAQIIFEAFKRGLEEDRELFSKIHLHFIGTDYAPPEKARKTFEPWAETFGIKTHVSEHPHRVPYYEALQVLLDSDFLLIPGSDNPQYVASKIYPYLMTRKPFLAVIHEQSSVVEILRQTHAGYVLAFDPKKTVHHYAGTLLQLWRKMLASLRQTPEAGSEAVIPFTAREMTRKQCELFDQVIARSRDAIPHELDQKVSAFRS